MRPSDKMINLAKCIQELKLVTWPTVKAGLVGLALVLGVNAVYGGILLIADGVISFAVKGFFRV